MTPYDFVWLSGLKHIFEENKFFVQALEMAVSAGFNCFLTSWPKEFVIQTFKDKKNGWNKIFRFALPPSKKCQFLTFGGLFST